MYVNHDGSVRELSKDERKFLETPFLAGDGGRPAIKISYTSKNGWGSISGFCKRENIPADMDIQPHAKPKPAPRKTSADSGFSPGSIGDMSNRIGYYVREFLMAGFTHHELYEYTKNEMLGVLEGKYTLKELRKRKA